MTAYGEPELKIACTGIFRCQDWRISASINVGLSAIEQGWRLRRQIEKLDPYPGDWPAGSQIKDMRANPGHGTIP